MAQPIDEQLDHQVVDADFDEDTGFPTPESLTIDDVAAAQEVFQASNYLAEMEETPGWNILKGFLGEEINTLLLQLRKERDHEKMIRLQCLIEALELLPEIVLKLKDKALAAQQLLAAYTLTGTSGDRL